MSDSQSNSLILPGKASTEYGLGQAAPHQALTDRHQALSNAFAQSSKAMTRLELLFDGLGRLTKLGPTVTSEDVIGEAGKLVGSGESPEMLATVLSEMPQGGPAIAEWLAAHTAQLAAQIAKLGPLHNSLRHQLGVSSLHALASLSLHPASQATAMAPAANNDLLSMPAQGTA